MNQQILPSSLSKVFVAIAALVIFFSFSGNPPNGLTGAPFDGACTNCHLPANTAYNGTIDIAGLPATIQPNTAYSLTITGNATMGTPQAAGFQLVVVDGNNANAGTLSAGTGQGTNTQSGRNYLEHRGAKNLSGGSVAWEFDWTSPASVANNEVKIYSTVNLVNGNNGTSGDRVLNDLHTFGFQASMPLAASTMVNNDVTCFGGSDGSATVTVSGGQPNYTYSWPNGGSAATNNALAAGTHVVTVTDGGNNQITASVSINQPTQIQLAAGSTGNITCSNPSVVLSAMASGGTGGFTYDWSNGQTGNAISVSQAGNYTVVAEDANGCTKSAQVTVTSNTSVPALSVSGGSIDCITTSVQISANAPAATSFAWSGPNGFTSSSSSPTVSVAGNYAVVVTGTNGCTNSDVAVVFDNSSTPSLSAAGGTITCNDPTVVLQSNTSANNPIFTWSGPNGYSSSQQNPTVNAAGVYTVTVEDAQGCTNTATATVDANTATPTATAAGGTLTCTNPSVTLQANTSASNPIYSWSGPNGFTSSLRNPEVSLAGIYTVTITGGNGCTNEADATVIQNLDVPNVSAGDGTIDCLSAWAFLAGNSSTPGVSFQWTFPNGTVVDSQNINTNIPGAYSLTVFAPNGCTNSQTTSVANNITTPDVSVSGGGTITCVQTNVPISASSTSSGATFAWSNGVTSASQNVSSGGDYIVTVTDINGCTAEASISVDVDLAEPGVSSNTATLNCTASSAILVATSTASGVSYLWDNGSTNDSITVTMPNAYTVTATGNNGCTSVSTSTVTGDFAVPDAMATGGTLTCAVSSVSLSGFSSVANALYTWTGPSGGTFTGQNPSVGQPGAYVLMVTNPTNGCTATATAMVMADAGIPNLTVAGGVLDCSNNSVTLAANSSVAGVNYAWTGPNGFTSNLQNPMVGEAGNYTAVVTDPTNGCSSSDVATVSLNTDAPMFSLTSGVLGCGTDSVQILLTLNGTPNVSSYAWTGPNGFNSTQQSPYATLAGAYQVTTTGSNGCTSMQSITVVGDATTPLFSLAAGTLNCTQSSVQIQLTPDAGQSIQTYFWNGPNGFMSSIQSPFVTEAGNYQVTATGSNGCTAVQSVDVQLDLAEPAFSVSGGTLTCAQTSLQLQLTPTSIPMGSAFAWSSVNGFSSTEQNPTVSQPGTYTVVVTAPNGCTASADVNVLADTSIPSVSVVGGTLDCITDTVVLTADVTTVGIITSFAWTDGNGTTVGTDALLPVTAAGTYSILVTIDNGCTSSQTVTVNQDISVPQLTVFDSVLTCFNPQIQLGLTVDIPLVSVQWMGPNGFVSNQALPIIDEAGIYSVVVTGQNGCTAFATSTIADDTDFPQVTVASSASITCADTCITLTASSNTIGTTYEWLPAFGTPTNGENFTYCALTGYTELMAMSPNGCLETVEINAPFDTVAPALFLLGNAPITCLNTSTTLMASSGANTSITWTDPMGNSSMANSITTTSGGTFIVEALSNSNGCSNSETVEVIEDNEAIATVLNVYAPLCFGSEDGIAEVQINDSVIVFNDLMSGAYAPVLTASNGCTATASFIVPITPEVILTTDGGPWVEPATINTTTMGGTPGYTYEWMLNGQPVSTDASPSNLSMGNYMVMVTDANGCSYTFGPFTVTELISTNEPLGFQFSVYPSPTDGLLFVEHEPSSGSNIAYRLFNSLGEQVFFTENNFSKTALDMTTLPQGIYLLQVQEADSPNVRRTVRVVKQ